MFSKLSFWCEYTSYAAAFVQIARHINKQKNICVHAPRLREYPALQMNPKQSVALQTVDGFDFKVELLDEYNRYS